MRDIFKERLANIIPQYKGRLNEGDIEKYADRLSYLYGSEKLARGISDGLIATSLITDPVEQVKSVTRRQLGLDDSLNMAQVESTGANILGVEAFDNLGQRRQRYQKIVNTIDSPEIDDTVGVFLRLPHSGMGYNNKQSLASYLPKKDKYFSKVMGSLVVDQANPDILHSYENIPAMEFSRWGKYGKPHDMNSQDWKELDLEGKRHKAVFHWDEGGEAAEVKEALANSPALRAYLLFGSPGVKRDEPNGRYWDLTGHKYDLINTESLSTPDGAGYTYVPRLITNEQRNLYKPGNHQNLPFNEHRYFTQGEGIDLLKSIGLKFLGEKRNAPIKQIEIDPSQPLFRPTKNSRQGEYKANVPLSTLSLTTPNDAQPQSLQDLLAILNIPTRKQKAREWEKEAWDTFYENKGYGVSKDVLDRLLKDALDRQSSRLNIEKGTNEGITMFSLASKDTPYQQRDYQNMKKLEKETWTDYYDAKGRGASEEELNGLKKKAQGYNKAARELDVGFSKGYREGVKQGTVLPMTIPKTESNLVTAVGGVPEENKGHEQIVRYNKSYLFETFPDNWDMGLNWTGKVGYHLGAIKADIVGFGSKSRLWNIFPLEQLNKVGMERTLNDKMQVDKQYKGSYYKRKPTKEETATAAAAMWATGEVALITGGNYNPLNISEGMRAPGTEALSPDEDDPRKSTAPVNDMAQRALFFRKGRILPWEEFHQERPDVSYQKYQEYKDWAYNKTPDPVRDMTMGLVKVNPSNMEGQPEINMMGVTATPLSIAATAGTYHLLSKNLWKFL